ncbi:hypothetical protein [Solirubrobacter soli]|uniref:hypothetical protein n=1 Tax=Solirubrobacter soli TaxID=363832 RepID=UPI00048494EC|nr:hypothetical protein [Solirubrobacter soli]
MIAKELLDDAMQRALKEPELEAALKLLKDRERVLENLKRNARKHADDIERSAFTALEALRVCQRDFTAMLETIARSRAASGDVEAERVVKLSRDYAALVIRITKLEQEEKGRARKTLDDLRKRQAELAEQLESAQAAVFEGLQSGEDADRLLAAEKARVDASRELAVRALLEQGILPLWRSELNTLLESEDALSSGEKRRYRTSLEGARPDGLSTLPDREREIVTEANGRLQRVFEQLPGGSIGISGPRGVGKTTLLRAVCKADAPRGAADHLAVMVYAPVKYASLDFVLHLLETTCRASLPPDSYVDPLEEGVDARLRRAERSVKLATRIAIGVGVLAGVIGLLLTIKALRADGSPEATRQLLAAASVLGAALVILAIAQQRGRAFAAGAAVSSGAATAAVVATIVSDWTPVTWGIVAAGALAGWPLLAILPTWVAARSIRRPWHASIVVLAGGAVFVAIVAGTGRNLDPPSGLGAMIVLGAALIGPLAARLVRKAFVLDPTELTRRATLKRVDDIASSADRLAKGLVATGTVVAVSGLAVVGLGMLNTPPSTALSAALTLALSGGALAALLSDISPLASSALDQRPVTLPPSVSAVEAVAETGWTSKLEPEQLERLEALARANLQRIKYQRAFNAGWSTKVGFTGNTIKLPFSAEASTTGGRSSTEQAMTLPEVVGLLREFLQIASTTAGSMVVAIDEMDKMGSDEDAERFLNDVKAIFGIPRCYFLISVSEDAVASFERRGMPFRDVFDSALDDVLRVDHLAVDGTELLLTARTIDMSEPFKALCHALAGGLPRDVIRVARRLFDLRDQRRVEGLTALTRALAAEELKAKRDGTVTAAARLGARADATAILGWLGDASPVPDAKVLEDALKTLPTFNADGDEVARALERLVRELAAYWYLCVTLTEFFIDERTPFEFLMAESEGGLGSIAQLARARQAFTIDPGLAWQRVSAFREDWNLPTLSLNR